jgi:hypothetical protein
MSAHAFIAYLRIEAQHEEERARVLRALADSIQSGSTDDSKWDRQIGALSTLPLGFTFFHPFLPSFFIFRQAGSRHEAQGYNKGETVQAHGLQSLYTGERRRVTGRKSHYGSQGYYFHRRTPLGENDRRRKAGKVHLN